MKYKVGDKVRVKSIDWYNQNKDSRKRVALKNDYYFTEAMSRFCDAILTIKDVCVSQNFSHYSMREVGYAWTDDMIEGVAGKDTEEAMKEIVFTHHIGLDSEEIHIADGYEFQDENGDTIYARKLKVVKKKSKYPATYEECCKVLHYAYGQGITMRGVTEEEEELFRILIVLKRCRDAYWKIAGEQMGLGKPWKPDFKDSNVNKYVIYTNSNGCIINECFGICNYKILAFPTSEVRDTFYENFKDLINECKELL